MSIRIAILTLLVVALAIYAWRDWFVSLCGLILLMAVIQHPDMPSNILGIQGLNPWNVLMLSVLLAWGVQRRREGLVWDLPGYISVMLVLYLLVVFVGVARLLADRSHLEGFAFGDLISENLVNTVKWAIPGLLLFDGCRTRGRVVAALGCILALYVLLAVQVIRWMPISAVAQSGAELNHLGLKFIQSEIGYSRVNMSRMLAGGCWALLAFLPLAVRRRRKIAIALLAMAVAYAQALTGGRMGYVTWGVVGVAMCLLRWRKALILLPIVPIVVAIVLPGVSDRMLQGFGATDVTGQETVDDYEATSGRTLIWPYVLEKISESSVFGYGRMAMVRTGLRDQLWNDLRESFPHPHNAYLECLLDNGIVGFAIIMPFYLVLLWKGVRLFLDRADLLGSAVGGVTCALLLALLVAGMGSQTFYPREGDFGLWAAIGLALRMSLVRSRVAMPTSNSLRHGSRALAVARCSSRQGVSLDPRLRALER